MELYRLRNSEVNFLASASVGGTFAVYAGRGTKNTLFTNGSSTDRYFTNFPIRSATVQIGEIFVPVPEPAGPS
jgi:hypothetical protein